MVVDPAAQVRDTGFDVVFAHDYSPFAYLSLHVKPQHNVVSLSFAHNADFLYRLTIYVASDVMLRTGMEYEVFLAKVEDGVVINQAEAARRLGVDRTTIGRMLKRLAATGSARTTRTVTTSLLARLSLFEVENDFFSRLKCLFKHSADEYGS